MHKRKLGMHNVRFKHYINPYYLRIAPPIGPNVLSSEVIISLPCRFIFNNSIAFESYTVPINFLLSSLIQMMDYILNSPITNVIPVTM